jgi:hypothetical protein
MWPEVYHLQNGDYVEASRDFPHFYDEEVLPNLDNQITKAQQMDLPDNAAVSRWSTIKSFASWPESNGRVAACEGVDDKFRSRNSATRVRSLR